MLVNLLITSRLDYANALLHGCHPSKLIAYRICCSIGHVIK